MADKKILVMVLSTNADPWRKIEILGQDATWKQVKVPNVEILRYFSTGQNILLHFMSKVYWHFERLILRRFPGNVISKSWKKYIESINVEVTTEATQITVSLTESYSLIGLKTINAFDAILKTKNFDYVYRTNVSSYIDVKKLAKFVENLSDENLIFYGGAIGEHNKNIFASGSGYLIGRNALVRAMASKNKWDHSLIDDVALGKLLLEECQISPTMLPRIDLDSAEKARKTIYNNDMIFHYRCKSKDHLSTIKIMKIINESLSVND